MTAAALQIPDGEVALLYDATLRKPGCVLLQAVAGGDRGVTMRIPSSEWLVHPTADMKLYRMTRAQAEQIVAFHAREVR